MYIAVQLSTFRLQLRMTTHHRKHHHRSRPRSTHLLLIGGCFSILALAQLPSLALTIPSQWPGFSSQRLCVQCALGGSVCSNNNIEVDIGCGDWKCVCDHFSVAQTSIVSLAISFCSSVDQDVAAATSILDGFCSQLPGVTITNSHP